VNFIKILIQKLIIEISVNFIDLLKKKRREQT